MLWVDFKFPLPLKVNERMIHEVSGDILLSKAQAIAHGVAPNDHFDAGLALALRERWPSMAKDYRHYAHNTHPKPGEIWMWSGVGDVHIINLLTQEGDHGHGTRPGRASIANVSHCMKRLAHLVEKEKFRSLAIPAIATGLGGLSWSEVKPVVLEKLGELQIPVFVYSTYHAGVAAKEPGV
jgi:O-acetyl-ADP-ribose deacetylase (regulator of RNase III)